MNTPHRSFEALVELMARLRAPDGCPWDREQTLETLKLYLIEEAYEVLDVMDGQHPAKHREELGDLLLQVVFQAQIASENNDFNAGDVVEGIVEKMIRRHPHVFGDGEKASSADVAYGQWERIKQAEKRQKSQNSSVLDGVPRHLPALLLATRVTDKASRVGFDWKDRGGVMDKLQEEIGELNAALASGDKSAIDHELGDVLLTLVNLGRFVEVNPEEALRRATHRFRNRFMTMERLLGEEGRRVEDTPTDDLDPYWERAKALEVTKNDGP